MKQLVKTHNNIEIFLNEGRFIATVGGDIISKATLAAIEKAITGAPKSLTPVKVMKPSSYYNCDLETHEIVKTRKRSNGNELVTSTAHGISAYYAKDYLVYDQEKADAASVIKAEYDNFMTEQRKIERDIQNRFRAVFADAVPFTVDMLKPKE